ncbi:MAG: amidase, partial [Acidimicrobiia bacterium]|nr:amidase [Acidimicrobiia bacterium]
RAYGSETIIRIFDWYFELSDLLDLDGFITTIAARTALMRDWNRFLVDHPLVITPFLMRPMYDWDYDATGLDAVADLFASAVHSTGINYLGLPAGVIGMDLVDNRPAAVQIVGRYFREDSICDALEAIETANGVMAHQLWQHDLA